MTDKPNRVPTNEEGSEMMMATVSFTMSGHLLVVLGDDRSSTRVATWVDRESFDKLAPMLATAPFCKDDLTSAIGAFVDLQETFRETVWEELGVRT